MQKVLKSAAGATLLSMGLIATVNAALFGRLPSTIGGTDYQAYYDNVLDITWLANANLAASNTFGLSYNTDLGDHPNDVFGPSYMEQIQMDGHMNWGGALHWIDAMNEDGGAGYLGYGDWRLPTVLDTSTNGCNYSNTGGTDCGFNVQTGSAATTVYSEMASLWIDTLGNLPYYDTAGNAAQPGWTLTNSNTGPFSNAQPRSYWSVEYATNKVNAWYFGTDYGFQERTSKVVILYGWAVRSGDVSAVPGPAGLCDVAPISVGGNCTDEVLVRSMADLDAYVASNFGKALDANNKPVYKNLRLLGTLGQAGIPFTAISPCAIVLNANSSVTGSDVTLHSRQGLSVNWSADIDATGEACLISDKQHALLNGGNVVNANALAIRGAKKAIVGFQAALTVNGAAELISTGTGGNSNAKVGNKTVISAESFKMKADNIAELAYKSTVSATGELSISSGNLATSETLLTNRSSVQAGTNLTLNSGGKTSIGFHTTVTAGNNLDVNAGTEAECSVASITSTTYSSKSGNCSGKLP